MPIRRAYGSMRRLRQSIDHSIDKPMDEATGEFGGNELIGKHARPAPDTWNFSVHMARIGRRHFSKRPRRRRARLRCAAPSPSAPRPATHLQVFSNLGPAGPGRHAGQRHGSMCRGCTRSDFARAIEFLIDHEEIDGPVNIAAPNPLPNREFMRALREAWDMPNGLPCAGAADRDRRVLPAHRVGAGAQEPARRSRPPARCGI